MKMTKKKTKDMYDKHLRPYNNQDKHVINGN